MAVDSVMFGFAQKMSTTRHWHILQNPDGSSGMRPWTIMQAVCSNVVGYHGSKVTQMSQRTYIPPFFFGPNNKKRRVNNVSMSEFHSPYFFIWFLLASLGERSAWVFHQSPRDTGRGHSLKQPGCFFLGKGSDLINGYTPEI